MKNQAILTLLVDKQEILKVAADKLSPRSCEFICNQEQVELFRDDEEGLGRYSSFQIRLRLFPHSGPCPQYITADGLIVSVRRSAQGCYRVILNFDKVGQDGYRLIAEHLSDSVVIPINAIQSQSA